MAANQPGSINNDVSRSATLSTRSQDPAHHEDLTSQAQSNDRNNEMAVGNESQDTQQVVPHRGSSSGSNLLGTTSNDNLANQLLTRPASATSVAIIDPIKRKHSLQSCNVLNDLRKQGLLCDVVLVVSDGSFPVHRAIMSACSPYFKALFTNGMQETNRKEVFIPDVKSEMLSYIIDYAYTRDVKVTAVNVERLLPVADQFHVLGLVKQCCDFLEKYLDWDNCIGIRNFAHAYNCAALEGKSNRFILERFKDVSKKGNEILKLSDAELEELLSSDHLNVKSEEVVFECIVRWIQHDAKIRKQHIAKLLKCIRLGLLSTTYFIETVKKHRLVQDNEQCKPIVIEALKFLYDLDIVGQEIDFNNPMARPRIPHEVMFAVGGWSGGSPTNVIEAYDTKADRWITVEHQDRGPRAYHGCATVSGCIYLMGGFDGMDYFNSVRCFNPVSKEWTEAAPMNSKRCYVSVAVLENCIYAMGGFDGHVRQNTAEKYTPLTNQWSMITPMNHQRSDASATTTGGKVYIAGGFNGQECLNTAESYDPVTRQWTMIAPMRNRRSGIGVIALEGFVYAIGGFNGITRMNSGERYNPATNTWNNITEMYSPRSNFGIEVMDDMVYAIGGFNGVTTIFQVECYEPTTDEWYDCTDMNLYRSALSACVVKGLPNVEDYIDKVRNQVMQERRRNRP